MERQTSRITVMPSNHWAILYNITMAQWLGNETQPWHAEWGVVVKILLHKK